MRLNTPYSVSGFFMGGVLTKSNGLFLENQVKNCDFCEKQNNATPNVTEGHRENCSGCIRQWGFLNRGEIVPLLFVAKSF